MKALILTEYGGPEVMQLANVDAPAVGAHDVLIRTHAVGLNPVDALQRDGAFKALGPYSFPKIAGNELSGTVVEVGPQVSAFAPGDRVIARVDVNELGAFAEQVAVPAAFVAQAPTGIDLDVAAGLPLAGLTAKQALGTDHLDLQPGDQLLITGGSGGVGLLAIQLAKLAGAHVTVTASDRGADLVTRAGADEIINYRTEDVTDRVETFTKVLDLIGEDLGGLLNTLQPGGALVTLSGPPTPGSLSDVAQGSRTPIAAAVSRLASLTLRRQTKKRGVGYEFFLMHPSGAELAELVTLVEHGKLAIPFDSSYPVSDFRDAFARLESRRAKGKVVVTF